MVNIVAHRGFSGQYPENTLIAFIKAIELGVEIIEFDVHMTADGQLVVIHDETLDRTTNGTGRVSDLALTEIVTLNAGSWFSADFSEQRVPTLAETLNLIAGRTRLNIQLKCTEIDREPLAREVIRELTSHGALQYAYISSEQATIEFTLTLGTAVQTCNLSPYPTETYISRSRALGCRILQPRNQQVTEEFVKDAHLHRMEVNPFYANEAVEMRRLIACGVDGILTDYPNRLLCVRGTYPEDS